MRRSNKEDLNLFLTKSRLRLYHWLRKCLLGPELDADLESDDFALNGIKPLDRYCVGILYPIEKNGAGMDPASSENEDDETTDANSEVEEKETAKPATLKRRYIPPSSAGFSFFIQGRDIRLQIVPSAVRYEPNDERDPESGRYLPEMWFRKFFGDRSAHLPDFQPPPERVEFSQRKRIFNDAAEVMVVWRPHEDGWLTTVSLSNRQELPDGIFQTDYRKEQSRLSLFESQLECIVEAGEVGLYPRVDPNLMSDEEKELELQYKNKRIFAIGHGVAADWEEKNGEVKRIWAEFFPKVEVPQVSVDFEGLSSRVLELAYLAQYPNNKNAILEDLHGFLRDYESWIFKQEDSAENLSEADNEAAARILMRMKKALGRMRQGMSLLEKDRWVGPAFGIANEAMYRQMAQYDRAMGKEAGQHRWRPFQLAFLLMVIESTVNEDSEFRDTLDLIWFPTGGGKTEAYLGLISFLVAWRRLKYATSGGGTTVLMRYTLRLLTRQQFQRATRLMCALELIRRERPEQLGREPISVGMWVGEAATPNTFKNAFELVGNSGGEPTASLQKLVLDHCPWCMQPFSSMENFAASPADFGFRCTNGACEFGKSEDFLLPCQVVDEGLYQAPPTLLIATIDKFARLAWEERAAAFFGVNGNRPPELVIQDELHLITGALGSIAGLYEAALDTILCHRGIYPKYIASTATTRMAEQQVRRLYGRSLAIFPPPGLSIDDSFFARTVPIEEKPGRMYVGYLTHSFSRQNSLAPLAAALLAAPEHLFEDQEERALLLDAWWTMVVYHGSLKGVGNSHNVLTIEVPAYWRRYLDEQSLRTGTGLSGNGNRSGKNVEKKERVQEFFDRIFQLTSISSVEENALTFRRLEHVQGHPLCLDAVLATNMISVGLDVSRLAVMVVNGQPLTTAEYIQAGSRIGRGRVPGIVVANYYREQARSLSHYESFRPYHESFYRFVEPSSITPYTFQSRRRALHAALIIAVRHCCPELMGNQTAGNFDADRLNVRKVIELLSSRCCRADPAHRDAIEKHLELLVEQWKDEALRCRRDRRRLDYQAPSNNSATDRLLYNHDDRIHGLWDTLQSMRNVENTALLKLL